MTKTTSQNIYSFFGFWTYTQNIPTRNAISWKEYYELHKNDCRLFRIGSSEFDLKMEMLTQWEKQNYNKYLVVYWCFLPYLKFYRKFDLFRIKFGSGRN